MPVLVVLGIIVFLIAAAIFKVNKKQSDEFIRLVQEAKEAEEVKDAEDVKDVDEEINK